MNMLIVFIFPEKSIFILSNDSIGEDGNLIES